MRERTRRRVRWKKKRKKEKEKEKKAVLVEVMGTIEITTTITRAADRRREGKRAVVVMANPERITKNTKMEMIPKDYEKKKNKMKKTTRKKNQSSFTKNEPPRKMPNPAETTPVKRILTNP